MTKEEALKKYFGHSAFRDGQDMVVDALLSGRDALCVMPTGAGKSVCFQLPALMLEGITLVISPLISLMKDQVGALREMGVPAAYLNSSLTYSQYREALRRAKLGAYKLIYVAPERLVTEDFLDFAQNADISVVAVDEAHCVSQWGQDFRPSYIKIPEFIGLLKKRPAVGAFTATATRRVKDDISGLLRLCNPYTVTTGFDRENLFFSVLTSNDKYAELVRQLNKMPDSSGIIYCSTRKTVEEVTQKLCSDGFSATRYHAGLSPEERRKNQEDFVYDRKSIIVATNAFGMGIDKSNVAFVIHYNMPKDVEGYYQEAGRAGRDGSPASCILLYSASDVRLNMFLIDKSEENEELDEKTRAVVREREQERLKLMTYYCTTTECLRQYILRYFGETAAGYCGNCGNCLANYEKTDITAAARAVITCITETRQRYGVKMIVDILRASKSEKVLSINPQRFTAYGALVNVSERQVRQIIDCLSMEGYIERTEGEYPTLSLTERSSSLFEADARIVMRLAKDREPVQKPEKSKKSREAQYPQANADLFSRLRALRAELAKKASVPAYVVFTDAVLLDMCRVLPADESEMLEVSGVGEAKLKKYGKRFLEVIHEYRTANGI